MVLHFLDEALVIVLCPGQTQSLRRLTLHQGGLTELDGKGGSVFPWRPRGYSRVLGEHRPGKPHQVWPSREASLRSEIYRHTNSGQLSVGQSGVGCGGLEEAVLVHRRS